ncbi:MAG: glycosyltransferase [Candidatus Zixiibacteriota bacterium]|nr:MAG: glycosyltransferase [candidate division Zixibacteria bacterium]
MLIMLEMVQTAGLGLALLFLAVLAWGLRRRAGVREPGTPAVSVLVAARNEETALPACLTALAAQDYPPDKTEFILLDDASTDRTGDLVRAWAERDARFRVVRLEEPEQRTVGPKKRALIAGLAVCRGEIVLVTDADCVAGPRWVRRMMECFEPEVAAVAGAVRSRHNRSWMGKLTTFEGVVNAVLNAAVIGAGGALSCIGSNFAYRREAFHAVGGFDRGARSVSGDDDLLLQKFKAAGYRVRFCFDPEARVETDGPETARAYWSRKRRHLSAGKRYAPHWIALAGLLYLGCLATLLLAAGWALGLHPELRFLAGWGAFSLGLATLFHRGASRLGESGWWPWSLPAAFLFPLYFVLLQPLTLLAAPAWKGRSVTMKAAA